jgi:hypothetical protein
VDGTGKRTKPLERRRGMGRKRKTRSLVIIGAKWFDSHNGNTYHRTHVYRNGEHVHDSGMVYGYGDQWEQTAKEWLHEAGHLPGLEVYEWGGLGNLRQYCERHGIELVRYSHEVRTRKELKA